MYKKNKMQRTSLRVNQSMEGETIEMKIERVLNNGEAITDSAPIIYTERKDGVNPAHDPRTDRFEVALEAMDKVSRSHQAKRSERQKERDVKIVDINKGKEGGAQSIHGKGESTE